MASRLTSARSNFGESLLMKIPQQSQQTCFNSRGKYDVPETLPPPNQPEQSTGAHICIKAARDRQGKARRSRRSRKSGLAPTLLRPVAFSQSCGECTRSKSDGAGRWIWMTNSPRRWIRSHWWSARGMRSGFQLIRYGLFFGIFWNRPFGPLFFFSRMLQEAQKVRYFL